MFDHAERRRRLADRLAEAVAHALFLRPSSDLEYLTGLERGIPCFGNVSYAHGWVAGAFFRPGAEPAFVLPRMMAEFDLPHGAPGELVVVRETDDGPATFERIARSLGPVRRLAVGSRTWGETVMHLLRFLDSPELVNAEPMV